VAKKRVISAIADIQKHDDADRFREMGVDVYHGYGHFKDVHHVQIDSGKESKGTEEVIRGKRIVIATGSSPNIPPIVGIEKVTYLTNETIFEIDEAPNRLVVVGAGPIGLELAQSLARFGSQVTVIEFASDIFSKEDPELFLM
jgi:pyruvate/2-oxoglutarate dehydrogenase complex dihydrolipoamide dehydrogenase (E3) component